MPCPDLASHRRVSILDLQSQFQSQLPLSVPVRARTPVEALPGATDQEVGRESLRELQVMPQESS